MFKNQVVNSNFAKNNQGCKKKKFKLVNCESLAWNLAAILMYTLSEMTTWRHGEHSS